MVHEYSFLHGHTTFMYQLVIIRHPNPIYRRCQGGHKVPVISSWSQMDPLIGDLSCPGEASGTNYSARQKAVIDVTVGTSPATGAGTAMFTEPEQRVPSPW